MCDQIEAELACREIGDDEQAESRAFMDYTTAKSALDSQSYLIDPWPFKDKTISVSFEYWSMELTQADKGSCRTAWMQKRIINGYSPGSNRQELVAVSPGKPERQSLS